MAPFGRFRERGVVPFGRFRERAGVPFDRFEERAGVPFDKLRERGGEPCHARFPFAEPPSPFLEPQARSLSLSKGNQ